MDCAMHPNSVEYERENFRQTTITLECAMYSRYQKKAVFDLTISDDL